MPLVPVSTSQDAGSIVNGPIAFVRSRLQKQGVVWPFCYIRPMVPSSKAPLHSLDLDNQNEEQFERPSVSYVCFCFSNQRQKDDRRLRDKDNTNQKINPAVKMETVTEATQLNSCLRVREPHYVSVFTFCSNPITSCNHHIPTSLWNLILNQHHLLVQMTCTGGPTLSVSTFCSNPNATQFLFMRGVHSVIVEISWYLCFWSTDKFSVLPKPQVQFH